MKMFIVLSLLLCFITSAMAGDDGAGAPSENIGALAERVCSAYLMDGNKVAIKVRQYILGHMKKYEGISSPTIGQIINFLNHNKNYMTCGDEEKHYMKAAFDHGRAYDQLFNVLFFDELLSDDESQWVDINGISLNEDGQPETVLDYMYKVKLNYTKGSAKRDEIKSLIDFFELDLGGKRFTELPKAARELWHEHMQRPLN